MEADEEDIKKTLKLPNFDYKIFEEITSITKQDFENKLNNNPSPESIIVNGVKYIKKE